MREVRSLAKESEPGFLAFLRGKSVDEERGGNQDRILRKGSGRKRGRSIPKDSEAAAGWREIGQRARQTGLDFLVGGRWVRGSLEGLFGHWRRVWGGISW